MTPTASPTPNAFEHTRSDSAALVASVLLAACDEEIEIARRMAATTARHADGSERRGERLDSAYSRAGFACGGREALAIIVGDGVHAARAATDVRLRYDGWATIAEQQGCAQLAEELRTYVRDHQGGSGILVDEAIEYLQGARSIIAAA